MFSNPIRTIRFSLALVFIWFGILKLLNISPVFDVVANTYPFITANPAAYFGLAVLEIALGVGMLIPRFIRITAWIMIVHLSLATLGVLFSPQAWSGNFPALSVIGEFVVKNFVLMAAAFTALSLTKSA